jgi:hypothetical protein
MSTETARIPDRARPHLTALIEDMEMHRAQVVVNRATKTQPKPCPTDR